MSPKRLKIPRSLHALIGTLSDTDLLRFAKLSKDVVLDADEQYPVGLTRIHDDLLEETRMLKLSLAMPTEDDGEFNWELLEPNLLLEHVVGSCPALQDVYRVALEAKPPTPDRPWDLMVCYDEFSPGDMLNYDNSRKTMVLAFNFEQLGTAVLDKDYSWMVPIAVRSVKIKKVLGGWSHMLKRFFHVLLLGAHGGATVGVRVVCHERPYVIHYRVRYLGSDYDGIRMGFDWKGANSLYACLKCSNVFKRGSDLAHRLGNAVETSCVDKSLLIPRSNDDFEEAVDLVTEAGQEFLAGTINITAVRDIQMAAGQNFNPLGLFACRELRGHMRALDVLNQDWVHGLLCGGTLQKELNYLLPELGLSRSDCEAFLESDIRFPFALTKAGKTDISKVFNANRYAKKTNDEDVDEDAGLKGSASEFLALYSLLRHFVELLFIGRADDEAAAPRASFFALCDFIDLLLDLKKGIAACTDEVCDRLEDKYWEFRRLTQEAYGQDHLIPKTFLNHELPNQYRLKRRVFDAFICERIHLRVKKVAERIDNTTTFEMSTLIRATRAQLYAINHGSAMVTNHLEGRKTSAAAQPGYDIANQARCAIGLLGKGDIIFRGEDAGVAQCFFQERASGSLAACVARCDDLGPVTPHSVRLRVTDRLEAWPVESIFLANSWYPDGDEFVVIL